MMAVDAQGNEFGKLFVGGLHQSTTNASLKSYFSKFGEIEESIVMMDNRTGRSRGFGYIKYKDSTSVDSVLGQKLHVIDHKEVDPKRCNINMKGKSRRSLKIFVGGIAFEHDEETVRNFFSKFGRVTDVNLLASANKQRHRGFAFVGFDDEEVVKNLIRLHFLNLDGKQVEVKAMEPPTSQKTNYNLLPGPYQIQSNGRAVRGVRTNHFAQFTSNETLAPWTQWSGVGNPNGWTNSNGNPGAQSSWTQSTVGWNGTTSSSNNNHNVPQSHLPNLQPNPGMTWGDQQGSPANGWMPSGWNLHLPGPLNNRGVRDTNSLYSLQQTQRKTRPTWDPFGFAALTSGVSNNSNPGDLANSVETWNHSAAAANAALCQLTRIPMGTGVPTAPMGATDWNNLSATPPTSGSANWNGSNQNGVSLQGANSGQHSFTSSTSMQNNFLGAHSSVPPANSTVAAMAVAFGMGSPGATALPHWAPPCPGDLGVANFDEALYRSSDGYGISSTNCNSSMHPQPVNGLHTGDWRTADGHGSAAIQSFHPGPQPMASHPSIYK